MGCYRRPVEPLWAVTCYWNPLRFRSRLRNYRFFRKGLGLAGVPLLTVEWHPEGELEHGPDDADVLVKVQGGDLLWQKERLLNLAIARVPAGVELVAWLDCDIVFADPDWPKLAAEALERNRTVQLFSEVAYLDPEGTRALLEDTDARSGRAGARADGRVQPSSARVLREVGPERLIELDIALQAAAPGTPVRRGIPGLAWAARRSTLERTPLFDRAIVGAGDWLFAIAAVGRSEAWLSAASVFGYSYLAGRSHESWARSVHEAIAGRVGFLDRTVLHLYHGELKDRSYRARHLNFSRLGVSIERDLVEASPRGPWAFVHPVRPEWTEFMLRYFRERKEDGSPNV